MKITNEQLKQIIKEELEAVMNESIPQLYGIYAANRARKAKGKMGSDPDNPYRTGYGPGASSSAAQRDREQAKADREAAASAAQSKANAEREQLNRDEAASLEALGQAKLKAIQALGLDEDSDLPYMNAYGRDDNPNNLSNYYDGPLDFFDAINLAKDAGELSDNAIEQESGGFNLDELFPGKYI